MNHTRQKKWSVAKICNNQSIKKNTIGMFHFSPVFACVKPVVIPSKWLEILKKTLNDGFRQIPPTNSPVLFMYNRDALPGWGESCPQELVFFCKLFLHFFFLSPIEYPESWNIGDSYKSGNCTTASSDSLRHSDILGKGAMGRVCRGVQRGETKSHLLLAPHHSFSPTVSATPFLISCNIVTTAAMKFSAPHLQTKK